MLSGIFTGLLTAIFMGIVAWAYSSKRRGDYAEAAQLPLDDAKPDDRP
ncbi:MAG: cbb3-type cytochrome c oxidase subunit 3 [Tahibacter sp.]